MAHSSTVSASLLSFFIHFFHHLRSRVTPSQGLHSSPLPPSLLLYLPSKFSLTRADRMHRTDGFILFSVALRASPSERRSRHPWGAKTDPFFPLSFLPPPGVRNVLLYPILQTAAERGGRALGRRGGGKDDGRKTEGRRNPVQSGEEKKGQMSVKRGAPDSAALPLSDCPVSDRPTDGAG